LICKAFRKLCYGFVNVKFRKSESFELDFSMFLVVGHPSFQIDSHAIPTDRSTYGQNNTALAVLLRIKGKQDI